jgi:hypothetical protein
MREITTHFDGLGLTELCRVVVDDEPHPVNGANHLYRLFRDLQDPEAGCSYEDLSDCASDTGPMVGSIQFQRGPRNVADSTPGTLDGAVLAILIDRQESFQAGPFACPENQIVLDHLRAALAATISRAKERAARNVLGRNEK